METSLNQPSESNGEQNPKPPLGADREQWQEVASEVRSQAETLGKKAHVMAKSTAAKQKNQIVEHLHAVTKAIRQTGQQLKKEEEGLLGDYSEKTAQYVEKFSHYINERNVDQILRDTENLAKRQPIVFLGGALVFGMLVGRFLKSSQDGSPWPSRETEARLDAGGGANHQTGHQSSFGPASG